MDTEADMKRIGIALTRIIIVAASLLGFYLLFKGNSLLQRIFGATLIWIGLYRIWHHSRVIARGAMDAD